MKQKPPEVFDQGVEVDIFDDAVIEGDISSFSEASGLSNVDPVGGLIGGAFESALIDEGFEEVDGVAVIVEPVFLDLFDI